MCRTGDVGTLEVQLPDYQKEQVEEAAERKEYSSSSAWVLEAIQEKNMHRREGHQISGLTITT